MRETDVLLLININYKSFTKSEKRVADYVLSNPNQVLFMSINELGETCKVSIATVFKFCKRLGFNGYQQLKLSLAQDKNTNSEQDEMYTEGQLPNMCRKILNSCTNALNETYKLINYDDIKLAVNYICNADRVLFVGSGSSGMTAMSAQSRFMRITPKTSVQCDAHLQDMAASLLTEQDVVVGFTYSGSSKDTINTMKIAKKAGAKTICITRFLKSPVTEHSDVVLLCGSDEGPLQGGSLATEMGQLYVLDLLYSEFYRICHDYLHANREKTSQAGSDRLV